MTPQEFDSILYTGDLALDQTRYIVDIPTDVTDAYEWITNHATSDVSCTVANGRGFIITKVGSFNCDAAMEVK